MRHFAIIALLAVAACTTPVRLQHPETDKIVTCGPYARGVAATAGAIRELQCIQDFKEQGYKRIE